MRMQYGDIDVNIVVHELLINEINEVSHFTMRNTWLSRGED